MCQKVRFSSHKVALSELSEERRSHYAFGCFLAETGAISQLTWTGV